MKALVEVEALGWRPLERSRPSAFAERYRVLKKGASWSDGPWRNANAPYLIAVMDAVLECLERGIQLLVLMKSAQGGGTEALGVNAILWFLAYFGGPVLYITAKDELAAEIANDRWDGAEGALATCDPVNRKRLSGKRHHEKVHIKRFTDAKLVFAGSQSVLNFQSNAYVLVVLDEVDSIGDAMIDGSDPVELAKQRVSAFAEGRQVLVIAFAHPSTPEAHVTTLYRKLSDQRRGHVRCPHCREWIAPRWEDVKVLAAEGQAPAEAERDPSRYFFVCPKCAAIWTEADRLEAIREVPQLTTLPAEIAAKKTAIGLHFWKFFMLGKTVRTIAEDYVGAIDDPPKMRVFVNKTRGEPYEERVQEVSADTWRKLQRAPGTPEAYELGTVPAGVQWLTAGQDSRERELHWAVWGWGLAKNDTGHLVLRGWLVDCGVELGPAVEDARRKTLQSEDLQVFDQVLYARVWPSGKPEGPDFYVAQGLHDSGWQPIGVYGYCRGLNGRAVPSKGLATDDRSSAPLVKWSAPLKWLVGTEEISAPTLRRADLNTYLLKVDFLGLAAARFTDDRKVPHDRLALPHDAPKEFLDHLSSERLVLRDGRRMWVKTSHENHWWDCSILAYAAALCTAPERPSSAVVLPPRRPPAPRRIRTSYES